MCAHECGSRGSHPRAGLIALHALEPTFSSSLFWCLDLPFKVLLFIPHEILPSNTGWHFAKVRLRREMAEILGIANPTLIPTTLPPIKKPPFASAKRGFWMSELTLSYYG